MAIQFYKLPQYEIIPDQPTNTAYLQRNPWDDFNYKTLFTLTVVDELGKTHSIGNVKIAYTGQAAGRTDEAIPDEFDRLPDHFYSLGQDPDYYQSIANSLSSETANCVLEALGDVAHNELRLTKARDERAFRISLTRTVNYTTINHQFKRILHHEAVLTSYDFFYEMPPSESYSGIRVEFQVEPYSKPPSNVHILIGRNGVGKTTLLNNMVNAILPNQGTSETAGQFLRESEFGGADDLDAGYFAGVVSVSFSAFDPFTPHNEQPSSNAGMRYHYVGLKKQATNPDEWTLKDRADLCQDFTTSLQICLSLNSKTKRWINAVKKLESDGNFAAMDLCNVITAHPQHSFDEKPDFTSKAANLFQRMSSGHAIVLLTITRLIETVEEKTLVLLDEPESHLHPPLLSAFTRALSDLLTNRNAVAIIATHSPVVLQEVPKSCVSIIRRTHLTTNIDRPESETFAENVGILTREVFGLEVSKSGFHDLLAEHVKKGLDYNKIEQEYQSQLGAEGRAILRSMIANRDSAPGTLE